MVLYKTWKNKLNMWQIITSIPKKEQSIVVLLDSLKGNTKAEKAVADIKAEKINNDGVKAITDKLDQIFFEESDDEAYKVYLNLKITISEYILELEHFINLNI